MNKMNHELVQQVDKYQKKNKKHKKSIIDVKVKNKLLKNELASNVACIEDQNKQLAMKSLENQNLQELLKI